MIRAPFLACVGALVLFWLSLTPSLMPRSAFAQALVSGICVLAGYGLGALAGWLVRSCGGHLTGTLRRTAWRVLAVAGGLGSVTALWLGLGWENEVRRLVGVKEAGFLHVLLALLLTLVIVAVGLLVARGLKALGRVVGGLLGRAMPAAAAGVLGGLVAATIAYVLAVGIGGPRLLGGLDSAFMAANDEFRTELPAPTAPEVSAGPSSSESWDDLGRSGRQFIANSPTAADISAFTRKPALHPIRAYVGAGPEGVDLRDEADRAVTELDRLGGFDRAVVNVVTGTGRGWVNENQAQALEYMWDGNVATVSMQYSYLPSWMSFLLDGKRAKEAGRALFDAVYAHWVELPASRRPRLVVSGESLGSYGGEAAFSGDQDLAARTSGALFVGPTAGNVLWDRFTSERDPGTPEVLPQFRHGGTVRFADTPQDWAVGGTWSGTRVGYLQHANDPISWWSWKLAYERPDWSRETRGRDVSPHVHWIPGVTMLQLAVDQLGANSVPDGQGHEFGQQPVYAWAAILPPPGWTAARTTALADLIASKSLIS